MYVHFVCVFVGISAVLLLVTELVNKLRVQNSRYFCAHMHVLSMYICSYILARINNNSIISSFLP